MFKNANWNYYLNNENLLSYYLNAFYSEKSILDKTNMTLINAFIHLSNRILYINKEIIIFIYIQMQYHRNFFQRNNYS